MPKKGSFFCSTQPDLRVSYSYTTLELTMSPCLTSERNARLKLELARHEAALQEWLGRCSVNAIWYVCDPIGAMRSANLGIDEALLNELESCTTPRIPIAPGFQGRKAS
jgi:hypothetical protein